MAAVLTRNLGAEGTIVDPVKEDGSRYRYEMIFEQSRSRAYADSSADLMDVLIHGYAAMSPEQKAAARVQKATGMLAPMQATILQAHDQASLSEEDRAVLLKPRYEPVVVTEWSCEVPLVLLDVHYAPYSDIPAPVSTIEDVANPSNIIWVRAGDEFDMLLSLNYIGYITLSENTDFVV